MDSDLARKAVSLALAGKWEEAIKTNKEILKQSPDDTETLNRLARAYFECGDIKRARLISNKVLKIDSLDPIASKNLAKWKCLASTRRSFCGENLSTNFIEEPGKTKLVTLLNLGDRRVLGKINAGDEVKISSHAHRVRVTTIDDKYLGRFPDDLAVRLIRLTRAGNIYQANVKSAGFGCVKVFIREIFRAPKTASVQSFPPEGGRCSKSPDEVPADFQTDAKTARPFG